MKKYDREKKKWVSVEAYDKSHKHKDKDLCKGSRPHNFMLVLPLYVTHTLKYDYDAQKYYDVMDEEFEFKNKQRERLENMGINIRRHYYDKKETRFYVCSICGKQRYDYNEKLSTPSN